MKRTPMKRTAWPRKIYTPPPAPAPVPGRLVKMAAINDEPPTARVDKEEAIQHQGYMRLVRLLPCAHCGIEGYTQFCHTDMGKGMGLKTDCRLGWPGCGPQDGKPGCHHLLGTSGRLGREERRRLEAEYAARTRQKINDLGLWPKNLPQWSEK
ncbi:hypothetical protein [Curvibacter lanceolatus]|uniref:hypothetical protein n=1 Tax=Curvibacter lanceolatus TaxID=86182 RepID=UPI0003820C6F|nr:hypothetical protein [Curvibacter lanceolatus]